MNQIRFWIFVGVLALPLHSGYAKNPQAPKKRIAVAAFADKSDRQHRYWHNVGDGMADMLATELQKTGRYIMVERNALSDGLNEQRLAADGAVQSATGAQRGQLIGAGFIVTGAVTEFGIKDSKIGVGALGRILPVGGGAAIESQTERVALDLRFFDTTTGQVIAAEKAVGESVSRRIDADLSVAPSVEFGKEGFDETVIGKATREAIEKAVQLVEKHTEAAPWYGRVVKVEAGDIFINTGEEDGRHVGDTFKVIRRGESMVDPDTGENLGGTRTELGEIRITQVIGKRLSKAAAKKEITVQTGDILESGK